MLEALLDADAGGDGVLEGVETEAEGRIAVQDVVEELSALLDLEVVGAIQGALVDSATEIGLLGLALTTADEHVQSEDIVNGEFLGVHSLLEGLLVDDDLVAVDQVLLELVGKDSLQGRHLIGVADLLDHLSHLVVGVAGLHQTEGRLGRFVGGEDHISLLASDGGVLVRLDHDGMGDKGGESVDMDSEFELDEVSFLDVGGVLLEGCVVAADLVDGDGGGEGEALEGRLFVIDLGQFLVDLAVGPQAEIEDLGADCDLLDEPAEHLVGNFGGNLVLLDDAGGAEGLLLFSLVSLHVQQVICTDQIRTTFQKSIFMVGNMTRLGFAVWEAISPFCGLFGWFVEFNIIRQLFQQQTRCRGKTSTRRPSSPISARPIPSSYGRSSMY